MNSDGFLYATTDKASKKGEDDIRSIAYARVANELRFQDPTTKGMRDESLSAGGERSSLDRPVAIRLSVARW